MGATNGTETTAHFLVSLAAGERITTPWQHWILHDCLSEDSLDQVLALPFAPMDLGGVSGERALHNKRRVYFNPQQRARHPICADLAAMFQSPRVVARLEECCNTRLRGGFLRIEYAQDTDGFWLHPHTDIGAKLFSMLLYVSRERSHRSLGTDMYAAGGNPPPPRPVARVPFVPGSALMFVPSERTFHGFERRPIEGVRKSLIINYVDREWRARHELAYPDDPVS